MLYSTGTGRKTGDREGKKKMKGDDLKQTLTHRCESYIGFIIIDISIYMTGTTRGSLSCLLT